MWLDRVDVFAFWFLLDVLLLGSSHCACRSAEYCAREAREVKALVKEGGRSSYVIEVAARSDTVGSPKMGALNNFLRAHMEGKVRWELHGIDIA